MPDRPRIVVTVADASATADPVLAARKNARYAEAVARHGGDPVLLDERTPLEERSAAFATMSGLLLSGGADIDPARYGRAVDGATSFEPGRDELEAGAWAAATERGLPILGLCRGLQAINVFAGGTLLQHVDGHEGPSYGRGPAAAHPILIEPTSRLAAWLDGATTLEVNTYHHQAVRRHDLAPGLTASAWADSPAGLLVEGVEAADGRFIVGVQCHPERTESTPPAFERLFAAFVEAARRVVEAGAR